MANNNSRNESKKFFNTQTSQDEEAKADATAQDVSAFLSWYERGL